MTNDLSEIRSKRDSAGAVFIGCCLVGFTIMAALDQDLLPPSVGLVSTFLVLLVAIVFWIRAARAHLELRARQKG